MFGIRVPLAAIALAGLMSTSAQAQTSGMDVLPAQEFPRSWAREFPKADFTQAIINFDEVLSGGPPRDGIPAIDAPQFVSLEEASERYHPSEPVIGLELGGEAKAYPLQILTWHEIVNDTIGGVPVAVTYCPLCNAAIVFDTRIDGKAHDFGVSGRLRKSDMIMYDRQTESWWQQFDGLALTGAYVGQKLTKIPSRIESFERFAQRFPAGRVLVPNNDGLRQYGRNPYRFYDAENGRPFLYFDDLPSDIPPMACVVIAQGYESRAYALSKIAQVGVLKDGDLEISWTAGQNSALDNGLIAKGRDVGNIVVQRVNDAGERDDIVYDVTFAFVYHAFIENGEIVQ